MSHAGRWLIWVLKTDCLTSLEEQRGSPLNQDRPNTLLEITLQNLLQILSLQFPTDPPLWDHKSNSGDRFCCRFYWTILFLCYYYCVTLITRETKSIHLIRPSDMLLKMILNVLSRWNLWKALSSPESKNNTQKLGRGTQATKKQQWTDQREQTTMISQSCVLLDFSSFKSEHF